MSGENKSTTLIMVRHGQARTDDGSYNRETPLNQVGRLQAAATAKQIGSSSLPTAVYTSPFPRALETAVLLCERLELEPIVEPRLAEFELPSTSLESAQQRPDLILWRSDHSGVANGETLGDFCVRVGACCEEIVQHHLKGYVVVVSHAGTIEAAIRWAIGLEPSAPWQHEFDLANGSITELEIWPEGRVEGGAPRYARLGRIGDAVHLGKMASEI